MKSMKKIIAADELTEHNICLSSGDRRGKERQGEKKSHRRTRHHKKEKRKKAEAAQMKNKPTNPQTKQKLQN